MEEDNYESISLPDSELSMIDEGEYTNVPTNEIDIDTSPESSQYSPTTEPISFSCSTENYLPPLPFNHIQNQIDEAPLTLPIEHLSAARELLILMVMMKDQSSNEVPIFKYSENSINTSSLPFQLSTDETNSTQQLEDWMFQPFFEIPPSISIENSINQNVLTTNQDASIGHYDDIIFNDIDQIINHIRRWSNGHRVMNMLCKLTNGEQRWIPTSYLRRDSRVSSLINRYYRDLKYPYWAK